MNLGNTYRHHSPGSQDLLEPLAHRGEESWPHNGTDFADASPQTLVD